MTETDRLAQFEAALAQAGVKKDRGAGDALWGRAGLLLMAVGVALSLAAAVDVVSEAYTTTTALLGVTCAVVGAALHIRAMVTGVLRYWLLRLVHEQAVQTDRLLERVAEES
ncbi:MAG: hypothetical protein WBD02_05135 [Acidimicrobiia bacterium]